MTRYVIDASVAVEYLLKTPIGLAEVGTLHRPSSATMCPHAVQSIFTGIAKSLEPVR